MRGEEAGQGHGRGTAGGLMEAWVGGQGSMRRQARGTAWGGGLMEAWVGGEGGPREHEEAGQGHSMGGRLDGGMGGG